MTLLLDEHPVFLLPSLVRRVGLLEAALLQQLHFWAERATRTHEGHAYVYKTYQDWSDEIGVTAKTVRGALDRMRKAGIVAAVQNPNDPRDRTLWWRVEYAKLSEGAPSAPTGSSSPPDKDSATAPAGSSSTGATEETQSPSQSLDTQRAGEPSVTYRGKRVPVATARAALRAVESWAARTSQTIRQFDGQGKPTDSLKRVVGAMLSFPEVVDLWPGMIDAALRDPWWQGPPSVGVVFGPAVVERMIEAAKRGPGDAGVAVRGGGRRPNGPTAEDFAAVARGEA